MKYLKPYKIFESGGSHNTIFDVIDCYTDLFDDLSFKQFKLDELPGYGGMAEREKSSKRPYVRIDIFKKISVPHDSIVFCNANKGPVRFESEDDKIEWLTKSDLSYFIISENSDSDNPGCCVTIYNSSIKDDGRHVNIRYGRDFQSKLDSNQFHFIKNGKLKDLLIESNRRTIEHLNGDIKPTIYSFDGQCNILYNYNEYRFKKSDLDRYLKDKFIDKDKYDRLMRNAI